MTPTESQRRAICEELGLDFDAATTSGRSLVLLDRLIALREVIPTEFALHMVTAEREWHRKAGTVQ